MRDLGVLPGYKQSEASAINARGEIVGDSSRGLCDSWFLWKNRKMRDLGVLVGYEESNAMAINDHGWIVGRNRNGRRGEAVVWREGTITGLGQDCLQTDINERGQVVWADPDFDLFMWENEQSRVISDEDLYSAFIDDRGRVTAWNGRRVSRLGAGQAPFGRNRGGGGRERARPDRRLDALLGGRRTRPLGEGEADQAPVASRPQVWRGAGSERAERDRGLQWPVVSADDEAIRRGRIVLWTFKR